MCVQTNKKTNKHLLVQLIQFDSKLLHLVRLVWAEGSVAALPASALAQRDAPRVLRHLCKPHLKYPLELSGLCNHLQVRRAASVAVRKNQSDVCSEALCVLILGTVHLFLERGEKKEDVIMQKLQQCNQKKQRQQEKNNCQPNVVSPDAVSTLMVLRSMKFLMPSWWSRSRWASASVRL